MTEGDSTDKLSAKREFVLVVRVVVEAGGKVTGELVDPFSEQRRRFVERASLVDAVRAWIDDALAMAMSGDGDPPNNQAAGDQVGGGAKAPVAQTFPGVKES